MVMPQLEVIATAWTPPVESVTLTVKENAAATVGVPVIAPVLAFRLRPVGSAPELRANVYGAVPPLTMMLELYGSPTWPVVAGAQSAVIVGGLIVMLQLLVVVVACWPGVESVTVTVNENGPAVVGVPVMAPVLGFSVRPPGREPLLIANAYGA